MEARAAKLTPKQKAFVDEYLVDLNASAAARRAGYSERTADRTAHENLKKPEIAAAIAAAQAERSARTLVTADMVVEGLLAEARLSGEGSSHGARVAAWTALGKHLGMFVQRRELTGAGGGPIQQRHTHDAGESLDDRLAPYAAALAAFLGGGGEVRPDGPAEPVDPAQASPQAGAVPPA